MITVIVVSLDANPLLGKLNDIILKPSEFNPIFVLILYDSIVCMDTNKHACSQAWSPLSAPRLPYDCARSFSKRKTCPKMCGVCGKYFIQVAHQI